MTTCPVCAGGRLRAAHVPPGRALVRCGDCQLLFAPQFVAVPAPRTRLSEEERRLEERVAERRTPHFARLLRTVRPPGRLLDVGTGVGRLLEVARDAGWQAVGVDIDPAVLAHARARGLDARGGELETLGLPASSFDLVTLWNVLDFVRDPLALLSECRRLLAPDGRVFVRTPNVPVQRAGARLAEMSMAIGLGRLVGDDSRSVGVFNVSNFGAPALRVALARAGFRDVAVSNSAPIGGDPYLGVGPLGERVIDLGKRVVFGVAQAAALASGGRWLIAPSLEAWGRKGT